MLPVNMVWNFFVAPPGCERRPSPTKLGMMIEDVRTILPSLKRVRIRHVLFRY